MHDRQGVTNPSTVFTALFAVVALCAVGYGVYRLAESTPPSWTLVLTVIASVIICGSLLIHVGRAPGFPVVGASVAMLAIQPVDSQLLSVCIWAIGLAVSQTVVLRSLRRGLYATGLNAVCALAFAAIQTGLIARGVWLLPAFLVATAAYYALFVGVELARERVRESGEHRDRFSGFSAVSPSRLGLVVLSVAAVAALMRYIDASVIPWLESDPSVSRTPLVVLLAASMLYILAQRLRFTRSEGRLRALVDAAVELPRESAGELPSALRSRAQDILQTARVELRESPPERDEIGAAVTLQPDAEQYLIAAPSSGGTPFDRDDEHALTTLAHVASEAARIQSEVDSLERRANTDALTGLPNYGAFQQALAEANENRGFHEGIALLFIDLDNFKKLNDNFGHQAGDDLLRAVAERLQGAIGGGDFVSRVGGDEFVVILSDLVSLEQAKDAADGIIERVSRPLALDGRRTQPVVSAGLAFSGHRELNARALVEDADRTMLQAKRTRHANGSVENSVQVSSHRATRTNDIIARAIREQRCFPVFQPIVSLEHGTIWAFEVLVRYLGPELGPVSPPSLVARAKDLGLMNELTEQVVSKGLAAAERFRELEPDLTCMTVNLELGQISESELGPFIRRAAAAHPEISLCVELNERSLRSATDELRRDAESMQAAGLLIALDDYGSDDSPVGALVHFPMNVLKLDKSLINDLDDVRQREVVKALQSFGDNLGHTLVVEGVETRAMADALAELGARNAQGYYFGRPATFEQTVRRLEQWGAQGRIDA